MKSGHFNILLAVLTICIFSVIAGCGSKDSTDERTNTAPVANAGTAQNVSVGTLVTVDGSGSSDANSDTLKYSWSLTSKPLGSIAALSSATVSKPTFTVDVAGSYILSLVVNDGKVDSSAVTVTVTATTSVPNTAPVANAGNGQNVALGSLVTLDGSASSDANNDSLTYLWSLTSKPIGSIAVLSSLSSQKPTFIADVAGTYLFSLIVNDSKANSQAVAVAVTAAPSSVDTNFAPVANAGNAKTVSVGTLVELDGSASSDANSDTLTYSWTLTAKPNGSSAILSSATAAKPTFTADVAGTYTFSLTVNDGKVNSSAASVSVTAKSTTGSITIKW